MFEQVAKAQTGQYGNTRCKCICPDPQVVFANSSAGGSSSSNASNRTFTCDIVVLPEITKNPNINIKGKEGEFCPRCECKYESRNLQIIKVVVIIVMWVVSLLVIYMLFLMCLDPLVNKRIKTTAYQEHTNEDDESVGGGRTSHPMRVTGSSSVSSSTQILATTAGPHLPLLVVLLNRVGHQQSKWKRQVQEQRRNIYDRHTMLN
ncbi:hypothetical protein Ocin01_04195 [Orchesella cincta]|uniref:Transmembrane protein 9 n=1 Tax=Orchesella cincta TaxID=48709 RepID=A0A1D2NB59_ORCCI|nr:hypothetical protein Ocin01_04195 [Orchesella cincta]